jgi:hypothetical protein
MDNFQFWLYIIIAVIYVIGRALKKGKQERQAPQEPMEREANAPFGDREFPRQLTFEELLREITESKQPKPKSQPVPKPLNEVATPKPTPAYVDYDDDLKEEIEDLEDVNYEARSQERVTEIYEKAKSEAFLRPSLEETLIKEKKDLTYSRFKEFSTGRKSTLLDEYVAELRNPSGFKKAVVMSEILNRRF